MRLASMMAELKKELFVVFICVFFENHLLSVCYKLNVCVPTPQIRVVNSSIITNEMKFRGKALGRLLSQECEALMNGISVPLEETPESSLALPNHVRTQ